MNPLMPLVKNRVRVLTSELSVRKAYYSVLAMFPELVALLVSNPVFRLRGVPDGLPIPPCAWRISSPGATVSQGRPL